MRAASHDGLAGNKTTHSKCVPGRNNIVVSLRLQLLAFDVLSVTLGALLQMTHVRTGSRDATCDLEALPVTCNA